MATKLNGKTATELRAMIESKEATAKEVLAYLVGKGENIRKPSRILRDELAGVKPAAAPKVEPAATPKAEAPKPTATPKAEAPKPTATPTALATPAALAVALEALRAATAAVEALLAAQAAEAPKAKPVESPKATAKPKPVAEPVAVEPVSEPVADEDEDAEDAEISEDDVREHLAGMTVKELRELAESEDLTTTGNRAQLTERLVAFLVPPPAQATANKPAPKASAKGKVTLASAAAEIEDF